jgi:hypothetical protein
MILAATLAACGRLVWPGSGFDVHVTNATDKTWFVSVPSGLASEPKPSVAKLAPGADGFAVWFHDGGTVISVLGPDCAVVGVLRDDGSGELVVDVVPGLTGYLEHGLQPSSTAEHGITITGKCGGEVSM